MKPLVGEGREPLILMVVLLGVALPVVTLSGLPIWVGYGAGTLVTTGCVAVGIRRIEKSRRTS